jgi:phosphohistidine swiveling domain-containing protein
MDVAREYGIRAVVGTTDATSSVHNGLLATVDGNAGIFTLAAAMERANAQS